MTRSRVSQTVMKPPLSSLVLPYLGAAVTTALLFFGASR